MTDLNIREMRAAIERLAIAGFPIEGPLTRDPFGRPIVRQILDYSRYRGLNGEDTMTWLAYELLKAADSLYQRAIDDAMLSSRPLVIGDAKT